MDPIPLDPGIVYVTSAIGEPYHKVGLGLVRSFRRYSNAPLVVFTDDPESFEGHDVHLVRTTAKEQLAGRSAFYAKGVRRNVMKIGMLNAVHSLRDDLTTCWLDADTLVLDDPNLHFREGRLNVISHGGRDGQKVKCGNGLIVPGKRYAISGAFAVTKIMAIKLARIARQRPRWRDAGGLLGDQPTLNHLVYRGGHTPIFLNEDRRFIYNLEISQSLHPVVGDPRLQKLELNQDRLMLGERRVVLFCWIFNKWRLHHKNGYRTFQGPVCDLMCEFYR